MKTKRKVMLRIKKKEYDIWSIKVKSVFFRGDK